MRAVPRPSGRFLRGPRALALVLAAGLVLSACSDDADPGDAGDPRVASINESNRQVEGPTDAPSGSFEDDPLLLGTLPDPEPGLVRVDGADGSLSTRANPAYTRQSRTRIERSTTGEARAFQRLCVGEIDVVDSARPISPAEWQGCRDQGLDIVQFQVAADAVVVAIKNESDVGGDCLDTDQLGAIFGAGSAISSWSEVGSNFDDVPLRTGGPGIDTAELRFFGRYILNSPEPSLSNFAAGYRVFDEEPETRVHVVGSDVDRLGERYLPAVEPRRDRFRVQLQQALRVLDDARAEVLVAVGEQRKGIRDERTPQARAADDARVTRAYEARGVAVTEVNRLRAVYGPLNARYQRLAEARDRLEATTGTLGIFSESYYAVNENLLRPFEIQVADGDGQPNCIFPSPQTIVTGQYPLSRQLLLTTTTRALKRPEVADYLTYYLRSAPALAEAERAVALPGADIAEQLGWVEDGAYPVFASVDGGPVEAQETPALGLDETAPAPPESPAR